MNSTVIVGKARNDGTVHFYAKNIVLKKMVNNFFEVLFAQSNPETIMNYK
ncbi:MAG: hypothetical protein LBC89_03555 [Bacteroidales bacterium]|jgi:hypothetical protein|nr:hypothetical protein [Bacteroidales bacterium]